MTKKILRFTDTNHEWRETRRKYITATEMASLFQLGNKSVTKLIEDKICPPEIIKNEFMTIGNILEPAVLKAFQIRCGIDARPACPDSVVMVTDEVHRIAATPDGKYFDGWDWHLIECKTTGSADLNKAKENFNKWKREIPIHYLVQVHTQMLVTGVPSAYIGCLSYFYPLPFIAYKIEASAEVQSLMREAAQRFWQCFENDEIYHPIADREQVREMLKRTAHLHFISHE
jgi:putative phage-type endonuclease